MKEGKLRALAVTSLKRSPAAPEIATIAEQGLPGFDAVGFSPYEIAACQRTEIAKWAKVVKNSGAKVV